MISRKRRAYLNRVNRLIDQSHLSRPTVTKLIAEGKSDDEIIHHQRQIPTPEKKYKYRGQEYTLTELSQIAQEHFDPRVTRKAIAARIETLGWPIKSAVEKSLKHTRRYGRYQIGNQTYRLTELLDLARTKYHNPISEHALQDRLIRLHWSPQKAIQTPLRGGLKRPHQYPRIDINSLTTSSTTPKSHSNSNSNLKSNSGSDPD